MSVALKLMAFDAEDLVVISACVQDAVLKSAEISYDPGTATLVIPVNRFVWEAKAARRRFFKKYERRRSVLTFKRVSSVKSININRDGEENVLSLLAVKFNPAADPDDPSGSIKLIFAGGAAMDLEVECLDVQLVDLSAAWSARAKPRHGD